MNPEQIEALENFVEWRERAFEEGADTSVAAYVEHCENDRAYETLAEVSIKAEAALGNGLLSAAEAAERALTALAEIVDLTRPYSPQNNKRAVSQW